MSQPAAFSVWSSNKLMRVMQRELDDYKQRMFRLVDASSVSLNQASTSNLVYLLSLMAQDRIKHPALKVN